MSLRFIEKAMTMGSNNDLSMNVYRLEKLAEFLYEVRPDRFSNKHYRSKSSYIHKDVPKGCVADAIGYSTMIATDEEVDRYRNQEGEINFATFVEKYFGVRYMSKEWLFMFDGEWQKVDDSPAHCAMRIKMVVKTYKDGRKRIG